MTRAEFLTVMAWLSAAIGKPICDSAGPSAESERKARMDVYFECLGDLPLPVFQLAAKRVALNHRWATFPNVAELREAAARSMLGQVQPMSGGEAWQLAWQAVCKIDLEVEGSCERHTRGLPALVVEAMRAFGISALIAAEPNFARPQFIKIFDALVERDARRALLPASVRAAIVAIGQPAPEIKAIAERIGVSPGESNEHGD